MRRPIDKSRVADWIEGACMATPPLPPGVALGAASSDLHRRPESTPPLRQESRPQRGNFL